MYSVREALKQHLSSADKMVEVFLFPQLYDKYKTII